MSKFSHHKTREKSNKSIFKALKHTSWPFVSTEKFNNTLVVILAFVLLGFAYNLYAALDTTEYVVETLKVIPSEVSSDTWKNVDKALVHDLTPNSFVQSFGRDNSAFIHFSGLVRDVELDRAEDTDTAPLTDEFQDTTTAETLLEEITVVGSTTKETESSTVERLSESSEETPVEEDNLTTQTENESDTEINFAEVDDEENPAEEDVPDVAVPEESVNETEPKLDTTVMKKATKTMLVFFSTVKELFPFANSATTSQSDASMTDSDPVEGEIEVTEIPSVEVVQDQIEPVIIEEIEAESPTATSTIEDVSTATVTDEVSSVDEMETATTSEADMVSDQPQFATTTDDLNISTSTELISSTTPTTATATATATTSDDLVIEDLEVDTLPSCEGSCQSHSLLFNGFAIPEFDSSVNLEVAQIKISLGGRPLEHVDDLQRLRVRYSFGETWFTAGLIDLTDEVSNSVNGDYYLFALPTNLDEQDFANLQVELLYEGDPAYMSELYVDALWLEIEAGSLYEPVDESEFTDAIDYERDLKDPEYNTLVDDTKDFGMGTLPTFNLEYQSQGNFLKRAINAVLGNDDYKIDRVEMIHPHFGEVLIEYEVIYNDNGTWSLKITKQPQKIQPGKYEMRIYIEESGKVYVDTFEFYWGVLAINTDKSMYHPGESADLHLAALTDRGNTICNADIRLTITDPDHDIYEVPVSETGACGPNNVTDKPDYQAVFSNTDDLGRYTMQLEHYNIDGEMVHRITDYFEVRDYVPYDITRSGPTRIYPPAPYNVGLEIKANRTFVGDIVERVPAGFVITDNGSSTIATYPDHTEIIWHDVALKEGDHINLNYKFDAPDISPYLYLLGPLDMDGFKEVRQWQIASDALGAVAVLQGFQTTNGTELSDATVSAMLWATSTYDSVYFDHSTTTDSNKLIIKRAGDYTFGIDVPINRTDTDNSRSRWGAEIRVNGSVYEAGYTRSAYIRNQNNNKESSANAHVFIPNLAVDDEVEVYIELLTTYDSAQTAVIDSTAQLVAEYISPSENVFAATSTQPIGTTTLNQIAANEMIWSELRQDSGYLHSDTVNPEDITLVNAGEYFVTVNIPISTPETTNTRRNIVGRVLLDGTEIAGGQFSQGYLRGPDASSDGDASIHWSGVVVSTSSSQVLSISVEREADSGEVLVTSGTNASVYIQELPASDVIMVRGNQLVLNSDEWNPAATSSVEWEFRNIYDATEFTHSTSTNPEDITLVAGGDYYLSLNIPFTNGDARNNPIAKIFVNGKQYKGAKVKHGYQRDQQGHEDSSLSMTYLLEGISAASTLNVVMEREGNTGAVDDATDAMLMVWKKAELNLRPSNFTYYDAPFDNIRFASTSPYFDFSSTDPDGSSALVYEFSISTSTDFVASTTKTSGIDLGFSNVITPADTSPFNESERIRYQTQPGEELADGTTYYWRVRAKDISGSNEWGSWTAVQSLTIDSGVSTPEWFQTYDGQFDTNTLNGSRISGNDSIEVDVIDSSEIMLVYGESGVSTPRYRLWDGSNWGLEQSAQNVGAEVYWVRTEAASTRDEYVAVTLDANDDVNVQVYTASTTSWGNLNEIVTNVASSTTRGIDVAYETNSGDAIVVACDNDADPVYTVWDGSSWSATSSINVTSTNACNWVTMASDPTSDEIIMVVRSDDTAAAYEAIVWDGSTWGNAQLIGDVGDLRAEGMSVIYEESGDQAIVVATDGNYNGFEYSTWDGTEWSLAVRQPLHSGDFENGYLKRDEGTDRVVLCAIEAGNDVSGIVWDGGAWDTAYEFNTSANSQVGRPIDCEFETTAGRDGYIVAPYSTSVEDEYFYYATSSWNGPYNVSDILDSWFVQTERADDGTVVALYFDDVSDDLLSTDFNGTSWTNSTNLETNPSGVNPNPRYESFSMSAKRYQSAQGTVLTNPIKFSAVPNQLTWGDINFSSTEPAGASALVQIYYTNVSTCDTLIPDIALSGNSTGFLASTTPIDLSGVSTTTYSEICLNATIGLSGSNSAELNDWTLAWERTTNLEQYAYRWYDNLSSFIPTDPWPAGGDDVSENQVLTSDVAIDNGDEIRLRMSLLGSNIALATSSQTFKLQYSETNSCAAATNWSDVGAVGSTTALWRGFANSIVGSDWYDGNWGRRISITIDNTQVDDDLTNFPVYLDLGDLPSGFFSNVQGTGADIRITEGDGLTELPYQLVSINTGSETGELHFKPNSISSTTDTTFYIYYDNPSASAYAAGATYGSENVWSNSFEIRYGLDEDPTGAGADFIDSTSNGRDAFARSGMTSSDVVPGKIGYAINHDGNDGGQFSSLTLSGEYTISMWWRSSTTIGDGRGFAVSTDAGANEKIGPWTGGNIFFRVRNGGSNDQTIANPSDNVWHHVVVTRDNSDKIDAYIDGAAPTRIFGNVAQTGNSVWENFGGQTSQGFNGDLDEIRFASTKRSDGWVSTEFNNQSNPTGFYTLSSEELVSDGRQVPSTVLSESTLRESYEEESPTVSNLNQIEVGDIAEWDWVLENNNAAAGTEYCFRMTYSDGGVIDTYSQYPKLITNGPPNAPILEAPFDNEQLASTTPYFDFSASDDLDDEVTYQIQVSYDPTFAFLDLDRNSVSNFLEFQSLDNSSDKSPFDSGANIRFIPTSALSNGTTYWWRVRATDPSGSATSSDWSTPKSFTVDNTTSITTWFQTTEAQFDTDDLNGVESNAADDVRVASGFTIGTTTGTAIDYDDRDTGNAWGELNFTHQLFGGTITHYVEYEVSTDHWALIPDSALSGNSSGFTSGPVNLVTLDTDIYNKIRIIGVLDGTSGTPRLRDWTVTWGQRVEQPTHVAPFNNAKVATTTPTFTFYTTDPESDDLVYQFSLSTTSSFTSSSTFESSVDPGFANVSSSTDSTPFFSGDTISYTQQSALTSSSTYWWRARARDPGGDNVFSEWSEVESFTVDESITVSTWFQTTDEQFQTDALTDIETSSTSAQITSIVTEAMVAYGEGGALAPRYRIWNGSNWGNELTAQSIGALPEWTQLEASPTRDEYALGTFDNANDFNFQIYNGSSSSWGNLFETGVEFDYVENSRGFDLAYENVSGDLLAVNCVGTNAVYAIWDGSSWSATTSISLTNANNCYGVELASDPVSDEIILGVRHDNPATYDFEFMVWDGSAWGNATTVGALTEEDSFGMAIEYEESGDQALAVFSNGNGNSFRSMTWDGSSWGNHTVTALGDDFEWGMLARDEGSDNLALCYDDNDQDLGFIEWNGSDWSTLGGFTEVTTIAETKDGRPISCQYMTDTANDGDVMIAYTTNNNTANEGGFYAIASGGTPGASIDLGDVEDAWHVDTIRTADGLILAVFFDHNNGDRYDFTYWNGSSWSAHDSGASISANPSVTGTPFTPSLSMAARTYPNFNSGQIVSTPIDYDDGTGPRWDYLLFDNVTPGNSYINYQVYYNTGTTTALVPDSYLPGNSTGTTTSPVSLALLDRTIHNELTLEADFVCVDGDCPVLNDWTVEWSEGVTISGTAYEYDEVTPLSGGTVAIVVNGVLQTGKTGTIAGDGTWSINNVTAFENDTVVVFIDGVVANTDEAIAATQYDGNGDVTGMNLTKRHLTIGSNDENIVVANSGLAGYDFSDNENLSFDVDGSNVLTVCGDAGCNDNKLRVLAGATYQPGANTIVHDFENNGTTTLDATTIRVSGSWINNATTSVGTSNVVLTATTTNETIGGSGTLDFYNLTLGETLGASTWTLAQSLNVDGTLTVDYGTLSRSTSSINVAGSLAVGANGLFTGLGTTTFDGAGSSNWTDNSATSTNVGNVVIDGASKTIIVQSNVRAQRIYIAADDILRGGAGNNIYIETDFTNANSFVADTSDVHFIATSSVVVDMNNSDFYDITFNGVDGVWSFSDSAMTVSNDFNIATGTVTLVSGTTTIGGSFINATGTFIHSNGTVVFDSTSAGETITLAGTPLFNAFYNVVFDGSGGAWTFMDANATTSSNFIIDNGSVTLPSGSLTVGRDFLTNGGSFIHNDGEVLLLVSDPDSVTTNGSSFNDIRLRKQGSGSWYNDSWMYRVPITISATEIDSDLTNFPVYVDLADLPSAFFANVKSDGGDIRVTQSDGMSEVPREVVSINTGTQEGELHFKASSLSSTTDTTYYIYYANSGASDYAAADPYGAEAVWSNGFVLVTHMDDLTTSTVLNSANGSFNGSKASAGNPNETTTGKIYEAQEDDSSDHISFGNIGNGATNITIAAWFNSDNLDPGSGDNNTYGQTVFSAHSADAYTWVTVGGNGNGGSPSEARFCAFDSSAICDVSSGAGLQNNTWHYVSAAAIDGGAATIRVDGSQVASFTSNGGGTWDSGSTIGDLRPGRNIEFDGELDEIRISNVVRTNEWRDAAYSNQATTTDFYGAGSQESSASRIFSTTNTDVLGNFIIEADAKATFPTGVLTVGGSFDNNGEFAANGGTVAFNSIAGSETIAAGSSTFATLLIENSGGDVTIIENATTTTAFNLATSSDFILASGTTLESSGTFANSVGGASTTWTGSTVKLTSGTNYSVNSKTDVGDGYGTLLLTGDTDISMWNSSSTIYTTQGSSSIYSMDHDSNDGDLYIFGDYDRVSGVEYWSYETDFDGTDLAAISSERQANVLVENGGYVRISTSTLVITGTTTASTTIASQSGTYGLVTTNATLTAEYFEVSDGDTNGLNLTSSTTVTKFDNFEFTVGAGTSGVTVDATTIDTNPAAQFFNTNFVASGGSVNVTLSGSPISYWWFRDGVGDLYGEDYDNNDGNPGSVRWDNSAYNIAVSGIVYSDDGVTAMGGPTCDGSTDNVKIVVDGGTFASTTPCSGVDGSYSFSAVPYVGDPSIVVYLDTNGGEVGSVITKTPTADITNLDIYADRVMTRHENTSPLTIADMVDYDEDDDSDLKFVAATGTPDTLIVRPDTELIIASSTTFVPGGNITLQSGGSGQTYDGSLHIDDNATLTLSGTELHNIGGSFFSDTGSNFTAASSTLTFTATTSGKAITAPTILTVNNLVFSGVGAWNNTANILVLGDINVSAGTLTGTGDITLQNGSMSGDGAVSFGGGEVIIENTTVLGGINPWTFYDLTLGDGATTSTTTRASNATTTISNILTIATGHVLDAGGAIWELSGTGNVLVENGVFGEATSTVTYSGSGATNILSTNYYNLSLSASAGTPTYTFGTLGLNVLNDLRVGGFGTTTATLATNNPVLQVDGDVFIDNNDTLIGSGSTDLTVLGSWDNNGAFTHSNGVVVFDSPDAFSVAAGASDFYDLTVASSGPLTVTEHATSAGAFTLQAGAVSTVNSGVVMSVGTEFNHETADINTTWTDSVLHLYGGDYEINASTSADTYGILKVGPNAEIRMWNSDAATTTVADAGSLYSMDHAGNNGDLYIWGNYTNESRDDYWSYKTDFDGTTLGTGRQVNVYIATSSQIEYTGGSLTAIGTTSASTTLQNQGIGNYGFTASGTATVNWQYVQIRDVDASGVVFGGTPSITEFSNTDHYSDIEGASMITVDGSVITNNPGQNFNNNFFNQDGGITNSDNVTLIGSTLSAWRYTGHAGNRDGESYDVDSGNPGEIIWDDSDPIFSISGVVYQSDRTSTSTVCDGVTKNIMLAVDGSVTQNASTSCSATTGAYSITDISFDSNDTLTVFIDGETENGVSVTVDAVGSIGDMDIYENHVIVRHESPTPISIADIAKYDSSDDADIQFTAVTGSPDTMTIPANNQLLVWTGKEFAPGGNVTLSGGGVGASYDGTFELMSGSIFTASTTETHSVGGHFITAAGTSIGSASSTFIFTSSDSGRTLDANEDQFYNVTFNGAGDWSVSDATFTIRGDLLFTNGVVTLPTGTTTVAGSLTTTGGSFDANGGTLVFTATDAGNDISWNGSAAHSVLFAGTGGSWTMSDANATSTDYFRVASGTVSLPSGVLSVAQNFVNEDTIAHNNGTLQMAATTSDIVLTLSNNDLYSLVIAGGATTTMTDTSASLLGDLTVASGTILVATNTLSIGGSLDATGGIMNTATGTILFNSSDGLEIVNPGNNVFYNVVFGGSGTSGWTLRSATATNNFTLSSANSFTLASGEKLEVQNVFTNNVGGAATTWTGSELLLDSGNSYSINSRSSGGDVYDTLTLGTSTDIRAWNSSSTVVDLLGATASLYSQDHGAIDGTLFIFGDFAVATGTEYWNYATDFDGTALTGGSRRPVEVNFVSTTSSLTLSDTGVLQVIGEPGSTTTIQAASSTETYAFDVSGGTFNASYYAFRNMDAAGLNITGAPALTSLSFGDFELATLFGNAITISSTSLNANASKVINNVRFESAVSGNNIELVGTTSNAWRLQYTTGNRDGEGFDVDGVTDCGSIRWDDSSCLLVEQTHYRWRNNDGGLGVPDTEWFNSSWNKRRSVAIVNSDATTYATTSVKMTVAHDADMQSDFEDLRFTTNDGVTELDYWIEDYTANTDALVWVEVPSLAANDTSYVYMYYDNVLATTTSSSTLTFVAADDFEDGSNSEYSGDDIYTVDGSFAYGGSNGIDATGQEGTRSNGGIARFDQTVSQGEIIRYMQYIDTSGGSSDESCFMFGVQSPVSNYNNYGVCLELFLTDRMSLVRNVESTDSWGSVSVLASTTVTYSTGWYEIEVDWQTNDDIYVSLYTEAGTLVATTTANDGAYASGGFGFTSWGQNGGWDSVVSRYRTDTKPTIYFGGEQTDGGATWNADIDTALSNVGVYDVSRLRLAVENTGLAITDQEFRLEYASKGTAPSCESVDTVDYISVPSTTAACGSNAICMATSSYYADGAVISNLLEGTKGDYVSGYAVEDPSNITSPIDVGQNEFTELEYALYATVNATDDAYCLRVTDAGSALDSYTAVAEFTLQFAPSIGSVAFNLGDDISLIGGTTSRVYATTSVVDLNGYADLSFATSTFYHSEATAACVDDPNDCYIETTGGQCAFTNCVGTTCDLECYSDFEYHASPTDAFGGKFWYAFMEVGDSGGSTDFATSPGVDVLTLNALSVGQEIDYGPLAVYSTTTAFANPTTTIENIGNHPIDINLDGLDLTDGGSSVIPANEQKFATSSFNYDVCTTCTNLSTTTISNYELELGKPTTTSATVEDVIYWGIHIPFGVASNPHSGVNTFYAVND